MIAGVHESLEERDPLPEEHLVEKGYTDSPVLIDSPHADSVTIVGPVADDPSGQARAGVGFAKGSFAIDGERQVVTCPAGPQNLSWLPTTYPKNGVVFEARLAHKDGTPCPFRPRCTRSKTEPRLMGLPPREPHEALPAARRGGGRRPRSSGLRMPRGPVSRACLPQAIRRCGLRRCRSLGQAKASLPQDLTAVAIDLVRLSEWWAGKPPAGTRCSRFAALKPAA